MPIASALQSFRRTTSKRQCGQKRRTKKQEIFLYYTDCLQARVITQDAAAEHDFVYIDVDTDTGHVRAYTKDRNASVHFLAHPSCEYGSVKMVIANIMAVIGPFSVSGDALAVTGPFESFRIGTRKSGLLVFRGETKAADQHE